MKRRKFLKFLCGAIPALALPGRLMSTPVKPKREKLIQVESDELEPELERILYEIIKKTQKQASLFD